MIVPTRSRAAVSPSFGSPSGALLSASRSTQSLRSRTVFSSRASLGPSAGSRPRRSRCDAAACQSPLRPAHRKPRIVARGVSIPTSLSSSGGPGCEVVVVEGAGSCTCPGTCAAVPAAPASTRASASAAAWRGRSEVRGDSGCMRRLLLRAAGGAVRTGTGARRAPPARRPGAGPGRSLVPRRRRSAATRRPAARGGRAARAVPWRG